MKKTTKKASLFLGALLLSGVSFAAHLDKQDLAKQCDSMGSDLNRLAEFTHADSCAFEVKYAGWLLNVTSSLVKLERYQYGLENLNLAKRQLEKVVLAPEKCRILSPLVKPHLNHLDPLIEELEWITH